MSESSKPPSWEKSVPQERLPDLTGLIIRRLSILEPNSEEKADFTIITNEKPNRDLRIVLPKLKELIPHKYWWLNEKWQNKETPAMHKLEQGNEIYDFSGEIDAEKIAVIEKINDLFAKILAKFDLKVPKYLLFDDLQVPNFNSGYPMNGQVMQGWEAIHLYPESFAKGKYRSREKSKFPDKIDHFVAVLIHEYSHLLEPKFANEWRESFNWKSLEKAVELSKDNFKFEECQEPETCMSDYALFHSMEDFCESIVAFLLCPEKLQEISLGKFEFLYKIIGDEKLELKNRSDYQKIKSESEKPTERKLPILPDRITVELKKSNLRWR